MRKKFLILSFLVSFPLLASDFLTIDQQNAEIEQALNKTQPLAKQTPTYSSQLEINEKVVEVATRIYQFINENWTYSTVLAKSGDVESEFWKCSYFEIKSGQKVLTLIFQKDNPNQLLLALKDAVQHAAKVDCTIASKIVRSIVLAEILGERAFNLYVEQLLGDKKLELTSPSFFHQLPYGSRVLGEPLYSMGKQKEAGRFCYITNVADYLKIEKDGLSQGENVVCVGPDLYLGFGDRFKEGPLSEQQIADGFYAELSENLTFLKRYSTKDKYLRARIKAQKSIDESSVYGFFDVNAIY